MKLARLHSRPLEVKLALLSAVVTILVVSVTFMALRARAGADVRRVFEAELVASQRGLRQLQDRNLRLLLATSALVSTSPTLRAALQTWRVESNTGQPPRPDLIATIQREAQRIFADLDRDLLVVTDDQGHVLAAVGRNGAPHTGEDLSHIPAVRSALAAEAAPADSGFGVMRQGTTPLQVGCVAIALEGYPIGVLLLGETLDRLLPRSETSGGTQSVVTAGDLVLASSLSGLGVGGRWNATDTTTGDVGRLRLGGDEYVAASLPLGLMEGGVPATLHLVRSLSASLQPIARSFRWNFIVAGLLAIVLVAAGAAVVSRTALEPLARFITFLRSGAQTGAYARYEAESPPAEIGTLADAYNGLIDSLGNQHAQLEERTAQLSSANESLVEEIHQREHAEQALKESEEQLRQSQKLESLGTLAGGVAHDFNNLLSVILGYSHLAVNELPPDSPLRDDVAQISEAANRASGLVRQLLAFSRKQVMQPQIVDLNRTVKNIETMLRRLIGEHIVLTTRLDPRLARITADPGQIEQVVMNLVVNARDAMPGGGTVVIETLNVQLDERYEHRPEAIAAGPAVMLAVSDTGQGMDATTRQRIFEPFFTTKAPGKGTGLGLSTVYGIVRQSGGSITVYSEPGEGATFRAYFPPVSAVATADAPVGHAIAASGTETVLIAEDEAQLRALMRRCLEGRGYQVLVASHGREALEIAAEHGGPIHLLVTDVVMPHMSGKELADLLSKERPDMRVLFVSGYSDEAIERHGVLTPGTEFLQKPVMPDLLARMVREILDAGSSSRVGA